jgi:hypothetical protein
MNEAIARVGSQLRKNKYAQSISFGRDEAVSLMLLLEQLLASSARKVPSDRLFIVPTRRAHSSCATLERGLLILLPSCPKVIVVTHLMCIHLWLFCRKGLSFIIFVSFTPSCSEHFQPVTCSFCMWLRVDDVFVESLSVGHPSLFVGSYFAVSQIRGVARRTKTKKKLLKFPEHFSKF